MVTETILRKLCAWTNQHVSDDFSAIYSFGSLIYRDGKYFIASGGIESDIDLILLIKSEINEALLRHACIKELRAKVAILEEQLCQIPGIDPREANWTSVLPLTEYELYHSLHKGHDPKLIHSEQFIDLRQTEVPENYEEFSPKLIKLSDYIDAKFHHDNIELLSCLKFIQKVRNSYLSTNCSQEGGIKTFNHPTEALPKEIMRNAALVKYVKTPSNEKRTDLNTGLSFIYQCVQEKAEDGNATYQELKDTLDSRSGGRAQERLPINPDQYLLIAEILHDECRVNINASLREIIDQFKYD